MQPTRQIEPQQSPLPIADAEPASVLRRASVFAPAEEAIPEGFVQVTSNTQKISFPFAGLTVGDARAQLGSTMHVAEGAEALVDGRPADESERLVSGSRLEFVKSGGEKGASQA